MLPFYLLPPSVPPPKPSTNPWRSALGSAEVYPEYGQAYLAFWKFTILLSVVPDLWLWTPFVGGIGFNSAKASCLPREGEKEGHLGIINRVCGLQLSTPGPNVRHWSQVFSVWSKKACLLWGSGLLGILINSLVGLMDYQAVSWQRGLGWGAQIAAHKSACCLPSLCFNGSRGRATEHWYIFPAQQMVLTG